MSVFTYLASNHPLEEIENPHVRQLSIHQALELGVKVPDFLLEPDLDREKPDVILFVDDEENFGELSIHTFQRKDIYDDIYTEKKYFAYLEWEYTRNRAENLIQYIHRHLMEADEIELSQIWLGSGFDEPLPKMKTYPILLNELTSLDLERVFKNKPFEYPERVIVSRLK